MERFIAQHADRITGSLACFDRILFKGQLPLGWGSAMEKFIADQGLLIKDFPRFVEKQSARIKDHANALIKQTGRPWIHLSGPVRKEDRVQALIRRDGLTEGLVAILGAVEGCQSFKIVHGPNRPHVVAARRKCLTLYFYFLDRALGLLHVRLQTWFPFTIQICLNGHDWLAHQLDRHGIGHVRLDNAFLQLDDPPRAQRIADRFVSRPWPRILTAFARRVNPLLRDLLADFHYRWVIEQAEYSTDLLFRDRTALHGLYDALLKHAVECFSAEDVMTFLGRKLHPAFAGEVHTDYTRRWPGARVRHCVKRNALKMYDKSGSILRVETVINQPREFQVRRKARRRGRTVTGWFPLNKGVAYLYRYAEIGRQVNARYLDALTVVCDPTPLRQQVTGLAKPLRRNGRPYRGFNPADEDDLRLFAAILRGTNFLHGFRNADLRAALGPRQGDIRTQSARLGRILKRLHIHGLIAKIPRTRRWRLTARGQSTLNAVLRCYYFDFSTAPPLEAA